MATLRRFGVSIEKTLLKEFDRLIEKKGYANRSDALRVLIHSHLLETRIQESPDAEVIATITLVYDHSRGDLPTTLTEIQHRCHQSIVSTLHVHFDAHNCLEVLVVRGGVKAVRSISDSLTGTRGVRHGKLVINAGVEPRPHRHPVRPRASRSKA
jgi:CopG family nickel-responsive transcriptional regulator